MKKLLRETIYKSDLLFNFYFKYLYRPKDEISTFLDKLSKKNGNDLFFVQIGANDGQWGDPIYKFIRRDKWSGILIEPQKIIFDRLLNNYKNFDGLFFENVAIDAQDGEKILYKIRFTDAQWASGISSFIKNDIQKLIDAGYIERMSLEESIPLPPEKKDWIGEEMVKVTTLRNIFEKYKLKSIDLIMIDTEGYDFEIIKSIPFELLKPKVIVYEHTHFNKTVREDCQGFLKKLNYKITITESDTIAALF